ncbi:hypothetical protein Bca101_088770 [Brassica carinata]
MPINVYYIFELGVETVAIDAAKDMVLPKERWMLKNLRLYSPKTQTNHQPLLPVKDCATPPAVKKEVPAEGERG